MMGAMCLMGQKIISIITNDNNVIKGYFVNQNDSSYTLRVTSRYIVNEITYYDKLIKRDSVNQNDSSYTVQVSNLYVLYELPSDDKVINQHFLSETDSSYTVRDIIQEISIEECDETISFHLRDIQGGYLSDDLSYGGVKPEQWGKYFRIRNKVRKRAEEMARQYLGDAYGSMGTCHVVWQNEQKIFKEEYNIDWRNPAELNPDIRFD